MKALVCFRVVLCLVALLHIVPASAQMHDVENATPEAAPAAAPANAVVAECHWLLRELTNMLQLQPDQVPLVHQVLAVQLELLAEAAASPEPPARLTEMQLARLQQWEAGLPPTRRVHSVASLH